jgi:hypothetical protein
MSNLSQDTPLRGFIMMVNNYNCTKEFDVTYSNLRQLTWDILQWDNSSVVDTKTNLIVEMELMLQRVMDVTPSAFAPLMPSLSLSSPYAPSKLHPNPLSSQKGL